MKQAVRVEYLFPNINNKRKYKWLKNAQLTYLLYDKDIVDWSLEEYVDRTLIHKDNTREEQLKAYNSHMNSSSLQIYGVDNTSLKWDNTLSKQLAKALIQNPLALPYFIEKQATNIIGLFLGESLLTTKVSIAKRGVASKEFWINQPINSSNYKWMNCEAKYTLSILISVINELLDRGVNLAEYTFADLDKQKTYNEIDGSMPWNKDLVDYTMAITSDYVRCDGLAISQEDILNYINFHDLNGFLDKVMDLTETEYYVDFIEDAQTLDPEQLTYMPFYNEEMSYFPSEKLVDIKTLCQKTQAKLKLIQKETEMTIVLRRLDELKKKLEQLNQNQDDKKYTLSMKELDEITKLVQKLSEEDRKKWEAWLKSIQPQPNTAEPLKKAESQKNSPEENVPGSLEERMVRLEERMINIEHKVDNMEHLLLEYLKTGKENPLGKETTLTKEEQLAIVSNFEPQTLGAKLRKAFLMAVLKATIVSSLLAGTALYLNYTEPTQKLQEPILSGMENPITMEFPNIAFEEVIDPITDPITQKQNEELILEVICGNWGDGEERIQKLTMAGYDYNTIQYWVDQILDGRSQITIEEYKNLVKNYDLTTTVHINN